MVDLLKSKPLNNKLIFKKKVIIAVIRSKSLTSKTDELEIKSCARMQMSWRGGQVSRVSGPLPKGKPAVGIGRPTPASLLST